MPVATRERPAKEGGARENPSLRRSGKREARSASTTSTTITHPSLTTPLHPPHVQAKAVVVRQKSLAHMHGAVASGGHVKTKLKV